ncbi:hypothetical protein COLO4_28847 [Corchorus olitorius]|uniref:Thioredoxin-like protein n=1 Tax=Corchorus olitorius TaxID=93759 RepID=A0A1R3HI50_9ROSI|nr:hypothetical protein COLO4_28847 [Corchorus olitorius]
MLQKELAGTVEKLSITTVPTVHFFVDGEKKDEVIGFDVARIVLTAKDLRVECDEIGQWYRRSQLPLRIPIKHDFNFDSKHDFNCF